MNHWCFVPSMQSARRYFFLSLGSPTRFRFRAGNPAKDAQVAMYHRQEKGWYWVTLDTDLDPAVYRMDTFFVQVPAESAGQELLYELTTWDATGQTSAQEFHVIRGRIQLDCDADRDGSVGDDEEGKANWVWGEQGRGAIVLVDNDRDIDTSTLDEREPLVIREPGFGTLPTEVSLRLKAHPGAAMRCSILSATNDGGVQKIMGRLPNESMADVLVSCPIAATRDTTVYLTAHEYPGPYFEGLLTINLELVWSKPDGSESVLAVDRVAVRVAPWVMTPNVLDATTVYTCDMQSSSDGPNHAFLRGLKDAVEAEGLQLVVVPEALHRGDRWIQDEIEIGYSQNHKGSLPVVFDSPRDRGLDVYPEVAMLGADFGHFEVGGGIPDSLDAFGNLEVSPPVVVDGVSYPLGRVMIGGRRGDESDDRSRQMMIDVRQFLYAQRVQFPFEVYTDWLAVGHVDEIVCFVPDESFPKGFATLVASPRRVREILTSLNNEGHGNVTCFTGKHRQDGSSAEETVSDWLARTDFWDGNSTYDAIMGEVRTTLKRELGLDDADIVEIPVCFKVDRWVSGPQQGQLMRTLAHFPDMVNHLVLGKSSIAPKPYGPLVDRHDGKGPRCAFEVAIEDALPERRFTFIDDWDSYHEMSGEVHCGTNARREPFRLSAWWHVRPPGAYDIKIK